MTSFLVYGSICCWLVLAIDGVTLTFELKSNLPLKGFYLEFSCSISEPFNSNSIRIWKGNIQVTTCSSYSYQCTFYQPGYNFTVNSTGVFGGISSVTTVDEGTWKCSYYMPSLGQNTNSNTWNLIVYTIPSGLSITQNPNHDLDLSVTSAVLQCKTTGCTYPMPEVEWIFKNQSTSYENVYATVIPTGTQETCAAQEMIYTSTLHLPLYTIFNDNSDKAGTFYCRIEYPDTSRNIISLASKTVTFAVRVTEAILQQNSQNVTETLIVTSAQPVTLTCVTGTSRPTPTIDWYYGSQKRGSGASLTITFTDIDHNEVIYCQAYNIDSNSSAFSKKPRLYVKVRVTEAVMQQNNKNITETIIVTSEKQVTLSCVTGTSRPAPTIDWYLGSQKRGSGTSLTITFTSIDHNEVIYCQAHNTDITIPAVSAKARLIVQDAPKIQDISPEYKGYVGQYTMIQFEFYSNMDKNLSVTAHSNTTGSIHQGIIQDVLPEGLPINSSPVPDFRATIAISVRSGNDFGQYLVEVKNNIGSHSEIIRIIEQITPEKPINFHATNIQERQLSLMWQSEYHGRYPQTFVVEISLDNITWNNVSQVSAGHRDGWFTTVIEDLNPGSKYYLRLYGYNENGRGDFADEWLVIKSVSTPSVEKCSSVGIGIGGAVGVGVGGVVLGCIGAIIAFTIRRHLNGSKSSCFRSNRETDDVIQTYSNTEMIPQPVKPIYEELITGNIEQNMYDKISQL